MASWELVVIAISTGIVALTIVGVGIAILSFVPSLFRMKKKLERAVEEGEELLSDVKGKVLAVEALLDRIGEKKETNCSWVHTILEWVGLTAALWQRRK